MNLIGLHYVDRIYSDAQRATHLDWLRKIRPAYVNILGGAQHEQAVMFAHEVRRHIPTTRVIFRHYKHGGDEGMWTRVTPAEFISNVCKAHGYDKTDWYIVTDNEANATDLRPYAKWHADVIKLASEAGVKLAVGRFSTHNPKADQINAGQLDTMWQALADHPEHTWSPNVYFDIGNHDGLKHIKVGMRRMEVVTGKKPTVVLGEYAFAQGLDPHKGYRAGQLSGAYIVKVGYDLLTMHLPDVAACWYCVGEWPTDKDTFGADKTMLEKLAELTPPVVDPSPEPQPPDLDDLPAPDPDDTQPIPITRAEVVNMLAAQETHFNQRLDHFRAEVMLHLETSPEAVLRILLEALKLYMKETETIKIVEKAKESA